MWNGDEIYRKITGKSPNSEGKTHGAWTRDAIKNLGGAGRGGGARRLASALGVSPSTVRRWARSTARDGKGISDDHKKELKIAQRAARVTPGRVAKFTASFGPAAAARGGGLTITGMIRKSSEVRFRTLNLGYYFPPDAADRVIEAMIQGGPSAASAELEQLIAEYYCEDMHIESIQDIGW